MLSPLGWGGGYPLYDPPPPVSPPYTPVKVSVYPYNTKSVAKKFLGKK